MNVKELINELKQYPGKTEVVVFANGSLYPTLKVSELNHNDLQIGCGWTELDDEL